MDKGAHYHRCDFQVHTPRDVNWAGDRPSGEDERKEYGERFIAACRSKVLDAVAITDHHDVCLFPYIKAAAANETDDEGKPIPDAERIVVFPGMELTLGVPCQALLILDAAFPTHLLSSLYTVLAVNHTDHSHASHAQPARLADIKSFEQLCEMLDRIDYLKGHYIVLPNVSETGGSTLLRSGFAGAYRSMPCVGGYLDGAVSQLGTGNRTILQGRNKDYGFKSLGLFQTSDNRRADFSDLGKHSTWVQWATPTAEALRQACLAKETRISQTQPLLPSLVIASPEVSNCKFLGPVNLEFNMQFNCFIGGRGTGKSTILEYLRWALCDQPPSFEEEDESVSYQAKRAALIENTLIPFQGIVTVGFLLDNVPHVVRRNSKTGDIALKIDKEEFRPCAEDDVRDLLPIQAYSQKQLSAVDVRTDELIRFIRASIQKQLAEVASKVSDLKATIRSSYGLLKRKREQLAEVASKVSDLKATIRSSYGLLKRKRELVREIERDQLELDSLTKRVEALRGQLKGLTMADQQLLAVHEPLLQEEQCVEQLGHDLNRIREMASEFEANLRGMPTSPVKAQELPNLNLLNQIEVALAGVFESVTVQAQELSKRLSGN